MFIRHSFSGIIVATITIINTHLRLWNNTNNTNPWRKLRIFAESLGQIKSVNCCKMLIMELRLLSIVRAKHRACYKARNNNTIRIKRGRGWTTTVFIEMRNLRPANRALYKRNRTKFNERSGAFLSPVLRKSSLSTQEIFNPPN